ncbi:YdbH domain-containing protein [Brevundimonas sp.]|uniref:intermembrane phospholipid transport protein YdbH family protein n=1 Tax=Brevundimonas sp. TaxID=1871086 RepID=UPI0025BAF1A8|nr:YdbH domain-containing protein [Brevundimonas sp.]
MIDAAAEAPEAGQASPRPPSPRRRTPRSAGGWIAVAVIALILVLLLATLLLYVNRRAAAREVLVGWLDRRGIVADVEVERIELDGFVGKVRIGDPANPQASVERVEVDYAIALPWSKSGLGVTPSRIRLVRPVVRASWKDGTLSVGPLDQIVREFTSRPPQPDQRAPLVIVETGRLRLDTEYGPLQLLADAQVENGKLMRLAARMPTAALKSGDIEARGLGGALDLTTTGDRVAVKLDLAADRFALANASGGEAQLTLTGDLPYPDMKTHRNDGAARLNGVLKAATLAAAGTQARDAEATLSFNGLTSGWIETFRIDGRAAAALSAGRISGDALSGRAVRLTLPEGRMQLARAEGGVEWRRDGGVTLRAAQLAASGAEVSGLDLGSGGLTVGGRGDRFEAVGPLDLRADRVKTADLDLRAVTGRTRFDMTHDGATLIHATGAVRAGRASWPLFGPVKADDMPDLAEMKRALGDFALDAPSIRLTTGSPGTTVDLLQPVTVRPANGGVLTAAAGARPVFSAEPGEAGGGALTLTATRGRGLPQAAFAIPDWRMTPRGFSARLDGRAALDFDLARGIAVQTRGLLASNHGVLTYAPEGCLPITVAKLDLGENSVVDASGTLCPGDGPLVRVADGGWRADGTLGDVSATAPFLQMRFADAAGPLAVSGSERGVALSLTVQRARVEDAAPELRFNPLAASGQLRLADERWSGGFDVTRSGHALGRLELAHDGRAQAGGMTISAPSVAFAEGGLQPDDLSPLVKDFIQSPATGAIGFEGRFDWAGETSTSSGKLSVPGLDFVSPAGPVKGLKGEVVFTSLAPLVTAPDQTLRAESLELLSGVTDVDVIFALDANAITVGGGELDIAGGAIRVEPFSVPLDLKQGFGGTIVLDRVQLGALVAKSGFADKVSMDAVVSGRLPFTSNPAGGVRIIGGTLNAVQSGRLSISREALSDVAAGGGGEGASPNTVEDLAYQAMENLAFDLLTAEVNSLDAGRLGVLFHIRGRHDPPQRQELRLSLAELISRDFLNRPLPLPSGTAIDLTLDTTLNANQLLSDLLALNRARNGEDTTNTP